jgi:hypothetical protein
MESHLAAPALSEVVQQSRSADDDAVIRSAMVSTYCASRAWDGNPLNGLSPSTLLGVRLANCTPSSAGVGVPERPVLAVKSV